MFDNQSQLRRGSCTWNKDNRSNIWSTVNCWSIVQIFGAQSTVSQLFKFLEHSQPWVNRSNILWQSTVSQSFKYLEHSQPLVNLSNIWLESKFSLGNKNPPPLFLSRYQVRRSKLVALFISRDLVNLRTETVLVARTRTRLSQASVSAK